QERRAELPQQRGEVLRVGGLQRTGVRRAVAGRGRGRVGGSRKRSHTSPRKRAGAHEPGTYREGQRMRRAPNAVSLLSDRGGRPRSRPGAVFARRSPTKSENQQIAFSSPAASCSGPAG